MAIEAYRGINVQTPDPTGAAGLRLQTIHKFLADKSFVLEVAGDPDADDDAANTGTNGIARETSLWKNTGTGEYWISGDDATGAAVWIPLGGDGFGQWDNLRADGNTLSSTDTNGNILLAPNGTGAILCGSSPSGGGAYAVVGGGASNTASSNYSTVAGGQSNTASTNTHATVGGGQANTASGLGATVPGGFTNTASGTDSLASGREAVASIYGQHAQASGKFAVAGDAQTSVCVVRCTTITNNTAVAFKTDGGSGTVTIADEKAFACTVTFIGRQDTGAWHAMAKRMLLVQRTGGTVSTVGTAQTIGTDNGTNFTITAAGDNNTKSVYFTAKTTTGSDINVRWVARVELVEVAYAD